MTGRRAIVGLCMLCALLLSAFAAQSASAVTKGTTAYTCKVPVVGDVSVGEKFTDAHCTVKNPSGTIRHVEIAENVDTEGRISNEKTNAGTTGATNLVLKSTFGGTAVTTTATGVEWTGTLTNMKAASGEHFVRATGSFTFTGVTANHECTVWTDIPGSPPTMGEQGVVHTEPLIGSTQGQGDAVDIRPVAPNTVIMRFWLTNCNPAVVNGTYTWTGSVKGTPEGATISFNHASTTAAETLLTNGTTPAGIEGKVTLTARLNSGQAFTPISPTTVETP